MENGDSGASDDGNTLPGVVVTGHKKGWFGRAWDWVTGFKFHFSLEGHLTFGAQLGIEGRAFGREVGGDLNLTNIEIVGGDADVTLGKDGAQGTASGNYWGKNGEMTVRQGVSGGVGVVSGEIEREFQGGTTTPNDRVTYRGAAGPVSGEYTQPLSPDAITNGAEQSGLHLDIGAGVKFLLGVDVRVKLGFSHD